MKHTELVELVQVIESQAIIEYKVGDTEGRDKAIGSVGDSDIVSFDIVGTKERNSNDYKMLRNLTERAQDLGYTGQSPVYLDDDQVVTHGGVSWREFVSIFCKVGSS